jgi:hypothetical protein
MRKFTNKQADKIEQWLDEAFNDGYKAAELDAKFLFTAEANLKRAEAEFNKRDQPVEQRVQEQLGHPLYGRSPAQVALGYGTPDELYTFWGMRYDH